jgi:colicin import membrane protein
MQTKNNLPATLNEVAQKSGLEISKAEKYALPYAPLLAKITEFANEVKTLDRDNPEHVARAKRISLDIGKICSEAGTIKKSDKAELLVLTRYLDGLFNTTEGAARLTQGEANEIVNHAAKIEAERIEAIRFERWNELSQFLEVEPNNLGEMDETIFTNLLFGAKATFEAKKEAEAKAEAERLAEIEKQKKISENRNELLPYSNWIENFSDIDFESVNVAEVLEVAKQLKSTQEAEAEAQRLENERLKKEAQEKEAQRQAELKAEREKQAKLEAELQAKKDAEIKAENARIEAERIANLEAEKLAKAPIKKQLSVWVDSFEISGAPFDNATSQEIQAKFTAFKKWAQSQINSL